MIEQYKTWHHIRLKNHVKDSLISMMNHHWFYCSITDTFWTWGDDFSRLVLFDVLSLFLAVGMWGPSVNERPKSFWQNWASQAVSWWGIPCSQKLTMSFQSSKSSFSVSMFLYKALVCGVARFPFKVTVPYRLQPYAINCLWTILWCSHLFEYQYVYSTNKCKPGKLRIVTGCHAVIHTFIKQGVDLW